MSDMDGNESSDMKYTIWNIRYEVCNINHAILNSYIEICYIGYAKWKVAGGSSFPIWSNTCDWICIWTRHSVALNSKRWYSPFVANTKIPHGLQVFAKAHSFLEYPDWNFQYFHHFKSPEPFWHALIHLIHWINGLLIQKRISVPFLSVAKRYF